MNKGKRDIREFRKINEIRDISEISAISDDALGLGFVVSLWLTSPKVSNIQTVFSNQCEMYPPKSL